MAGLWLPVTMLVKVYLSPEYMAYVGGTYSLIMWTLMAYIAHVNERTNSGKEKMKEGDTLYPAL
jgi:hypothetical protein